MRTRKARPNLVFDSALTALALGTLNFSSIFLTAKIGSSNAANSKPGNTVTFTQVGTTITASAPFFAAGDVGALFKYGTGPGGAEQYIATFMDNQHVDVSGAGMSVGTATAGTVWYVAQTALTTPLTALTGGCRSQNYVTSPGACSTTFPGGANSTSILLQRSFQFPVQAAPYSVSEIGYSDNNTNNGTCNGRIVLSSPDSIAITEYYVIQIQITFTLSPNVPTAMGSVVTGFDSSGSVMFNFWDCHKVNTDGTAGDFQGMSAYTMDGAPPMLALNIVSAPSLNAHISQAATSAQAIGFGSSAGAAWSQVSVGVATTQISFSFNTAAQTVYAIYFVSGNGGNANYAAPIFVLVLTTPFVLPSGTFAGYITYQRTITRTLSN
ncbi:MAG: hypothetical protein ABSE90_11995 [Verrucomicrobiota bacterium]